MSMSLLATVLAVVLEDGASSYVQARAQIQFPAADIHVSINPIDPRTALGRCDDAAYALTGELIAPQFAVMMRCRSPETWALHLTGSVSVTQPVLVAAKRIRRGEPLTASNTKLALKNVARHNGGFLTRLDQRLTVKRHLPRGAIIDSGTVTRLVVGH